MKAYLQLMRPANIVTAVADILAGISLSYYISKNASLVSYVAQSVWHFLRFPFIALDAVYLVLATIGLYGGGVVMNDVFDAKLDSIERPERPIPSGKVTQQDATVLGLSLLGFGVFCGFKASFTSGCIALAVALLALLYDYKGKHHAFWGPLNMGLCRGGNLLLGASILTSNLAHFWYLAFIPIVYIAAITMVSRGEVHGGDQKNLKLGFSMYSAVVLTLFVLLFLFSKNYWAIPFILLFAYFIFPPLLKAMQEPAPSNVIKAVKSGVISLIVLDAAFVTIFANPYFGLVVLALLPLSKSLAKKFAVT
jgi:4-hydroxybenzoate polyprenyltransferase